MSPDVGIKKLSVSVQPQQANSIAPLSDSRKDNALLNCSFTQDSDKLLGFQHADKENLLMGVHVPRFSMIEVGLLQLEQRSVLLLLTMVINYSHKAVCYAEGAGFGIGW